MVDGEHQSWERFIEGAIHGAAGIRRTLQVDENSFRGGLTMGAPRDFYLYGALNEVTKGAMFLMMLRRDFDETSGPTPGENEDDVVRATTEVLLEELQLRRRRTVEAFIESVLFASTNDETYFGHFRALTHLERVVSRDNDIEHFHGSRSPWLARRTDEATAEVRTFEPTIDFQRAWYLHPDQRRPLHATNRPRPGSLFSSQRGRLQAALPLMTDGERFVLGSSYGEAYSDPSIHIHYSGGHHNRPAALEDLRDGGRLGLLLFAFLSRLFDLSGRPTSAATAAQLARVLPNTDGARLGDILNRRPDVSVGDFAVIHGGTLVEVVAIHSSAYGFRSFEVDLLAERPHTDHAHDVVPARFVAPMLSLAAAEERAATSDRSALRRWVVEQWRAGAIARPVRR